MGFPAKVKRPLTEEEVASLAICWQNYVGYTISNGTARRLTANKSPERNLNPGAVVSTT